MVKGGRHLLGLINEVLDISRIEVGRPRPFARTVSLARWLREVVNLTQPLAVEPVSSWSSMMPRCASVASWPTQQRLKQVLLNLVANASSTTSNWGGCAFICEPAPAGCFVIHVVDTGPGIAPKRGAAVHAL